MTATNGGAFALPLNLWITWPQKTPSGVESEKSEKISLAVLHNPCKVGKIKLLHKTILFSQEVCIFILVKMQALFRILSEKVGFCVATNGSHAFFGAWRPLRTFLL